MNYNLNEKLKKLHAEFHKTTEPPASFLYHTIPMLTLKEQFLWGVNEYFQRGVIKKSALFAKWTPVTKFLFDIIYKSDNTFCECANLKTTAEYFDEYDHHLTNKVKKEFQNKLNDLMRDYETHKAKIDADNHYEPKNTGVVDKYFNDIVVINYLQEQIRKIKEGNSYISKMENLIGAFVSFKMQNPIPLREYRKTHPEDSTEHKCITKSGEYYNFESIYLGDSKDRRIGRILNVDGDKLEIEFSVTEISNVTYEPFGGYHKSIKYTASLKDFEGFIDKNIQAKFKNENAK